MKRMTYWNIRRYEFVDFEDTQKNTVLKPHAILLDDEKRHYCTHNMVISENQIIVLNSIGRFPMYCHQITPSLAPD